MKYVMKVMKWVCELRMHIYMLENNTDWSKWRDIFSREVAFCKRMLPIEKEYYFCLRNATPFEWKCLFVKPALVS